MLPIPWGNILNDLWGTEVLYIIITNKVEGSVPSIIYMCIVPPRVVTIVRNM